MVPYTRNEEAPENTHIFPLDDLVRLLASDDPIELLAAVAGLQLMPENADRGVRLEALAHVCAARHRRHTRSPISRPRLRSICDLPTLRRLERFEDPFPNPFTENITFFGGGFIVFSGRFDETTFILRHLIDAVFHTSEPCTDEEFVADVRALIRAVLVISDEIARRADLTHNIAPQERPNRRIVVPASKRLRQLQRAVTFRQSDLADLLASHGVPPATLDELITPLGQLSIDDYQLDQGALLARPIVRVGSHLIVALPGQLLVALRHVIVLRARAHGLVDELAARYHAAVISTVHDSLVRLDHHPVLLKPEHIPDVPLLHVDFRSLDVDKLLYLVVLTDPLQAYQEDAVFAIWDMSTVAPMLEAHIREIAVLVHEEVAPDVELFFLLLVQGIGHPPLLSGPNDDMPLTLSMTVADLHTITWLPDRDPLMLWKFARAADRVRRHAFVHTTSVLDEYEVYRRCGHSYGLPDPEAEAAIVLFPIGAGRLRREVVATYDPHTVPHYRSGFVTEVLRLYGPGSPPIFVPPNRPFSDQDPAAVVVEGCGLPIWITGPIDTSRDQALQLIYVELTEAIAYWLWRCTPALAPVLAHLATLDGRLHLQVRLADPEAWSRPWTDDRTLGTDVTIVQTHQADVRVDIALLPAAQTLFVHPDNMVERTLLIDILRGVRTLLPDPKHLDDVLIVALVDLHVPLSDQKRIIALDFGVAPQFDPRGIPSYRPVSDADTAELLDELTIHLKVSGFATGVASGERRRQLAQQVVTFFYTELQTQVAALDPDSLLEHLVARHEALVHSNAAYELQAHNPLGLRRSYPGQWAADLPAWSGTAIASRFLLEYVVAQPPTGTCVLSVAMYDRLLALAALIVDWGLVGDLIHYNIADVAIELQPSGRIKLDREQYTRAGAAYLAALAGQGLPSAAEFLGRYMPTETIAEKPPIVEDFDRAAVAEWGLTLSEIIVFMEEAIVLGREVDMGAAARPVATFVDEVARRLSWPVEQVAHALALLSLCPRDDFLVPPPGYKKTDIYPWQFNRALSYVRRPFLIRPQGQTQDVVWGRRHVAVARQHLLRLCFERRLQAKSQEMQHLLGRLNADVGRPFDDEVADLFRSCSGMLVDTRVSQIGELPIPEQLGDIDVLVIDDQRHSLLLIECKMLAVARTPQEMSTEIQTLFNGRTKTPSVVVRQQARTTWFERHLQAVLAEVGVDMDARWTVQALIVVDTALFTPFLVTAPIPVLSFAHLARTVDQAA